MWRLLSAFIAAVTVFESVFVWNDYFGPLILIQKPELFTVNWPLAKLKVSGKAGLLDMNKHQPS